MSSTNPQSGKVYLVGAGPGDPGLITLRGVECLNRANVVLYDYLVNPDIVGHAPGGCELICLGRHGHDRIWSHEEINARMIESAGAGKFVVRLKGGDPAVFARGADETEALAAAGIPFEVVPGITAARQRAAMREFLSPIASWHRPWHSSRGRNSRANPIP